MLFFSLLLFLTPVACVAQHNTGLILTYIYIRLFKAALKSVQRVQAKVKIQRMEIFSHIVLCPSATTFLTSIALGNIRFTS